MILAKAPLRVSFFGGGSDIPAHYMKHTGATVSMAIDKYVYVAVTETPQNHIKVSYSEQEVVTKLGDLKNELVRETLDYFGITSNIEITTFSDIPTVGTGLGGSSAFVCALVTALLRLRGFEWSAYNIADAAAFIEIYKCQRNIGEQDQYASTFGGMNYIKYGRSHDDKIYDEVSVTKMWPASYLAERCLLIPTNITRTAHSVLDKVNLGEQASNINDLAMIAHTYGVKNPNGWANYAESLNTVWEKKKKLSSGISSSDIDNLYYTCLANGAKGGKLLGAGGGGYFLAMTADKDRLRGAFPDRVCLDVKIAERGAEIVYAD